MNCPECGNRMADSFTAFTVLRDGGVYLTEDVPCLKCPVCEHIAFRQEVAKKLERYASGRVLPASTYRAWVFKWELPIIEIPPITAIPSTNHRVVIEPDNTAIVPVVIQ